MANTLNTITSLVRSLVSLVVLGIVGAASWIGYQTVSSRGALEAELRERHAEIEKLNLDLAEKNKRIQQLDLANRLLKQDHRLARITVLRQWKDEAENRPMSEVLFTDIDDQGEPLGASRKFTIKGDVLYIEAWIVKYLDKFIEAGDPLRGTSVCLFRRLYGEYQEPSEGFPIDPQGLRPAAYTRGSQMPDFEREVWEHFWEYVNDPHKAHRAGIRAAHGDAPFVKLQTGKTYLVELRASDGLSIKTEDTPARVGEGL